MSVEHGTMAAGGGGGQPAGNGPAAYPAWIRGRLDPAQGRWLWLVKWLLLIPHFIVLFFLWIAFGITTVIAFFSILFTTRYPRGIFEFNVGVMRWTWRVGFYGYQVNGTDRYPPFSLRAEDYPAELDVEYPERLSRGLVLVKWWLLAIPHYIVVAVLSGGGTWWVWNDGESALQWGGGLIGILVLFAAIALLFTGGYPRSLFNLVMGFNRWVVRVGAYAALMTDRYPPFRLDMGETADEPAGAAAAPADTEAVPQAERRTQTWGAGRVIVIVLGSIAALLSAALLAAGAGLLAVDQTQRDESGFLMSPDREFTTGTRAVISETIDLGDDVPGWLQGADGLFGTLQLAADSDDPVFVGIGPADEVDRYLGGVDRAEVREIGDSGNDLVERPGERVPAPPASQAFWVATDSGAGNSRIRWDVEEGRWRVVLMNADASSNVTARVAIGAEIPSLGWIGGGLLIAGGVLALIAAVAITAAVRADGGRVVPTNAPAGTESTVKSERTREPPY